MTILYVIAHSIEPDQLSANTTKITRALKLLFSDGLFYVYLEEPVAWDNSCFNSLHMREQAKLMKHLLGDLYNDEKLAVHKFIGKKSQTFFSTHEDDD